MTQEDFVKKLLARCNDYSAAEANFLFTELGHKTESAKHAIEKWVSSGEKTILRAQNWTSSNLEKEYTMNYIAAFLTIDWIIREPNMAEKALKRGLK